jgi:hypothetical protein
MPEIVAELDQRLVDADGREYFVNVAADQEADGRWAAWLEFVPLDDAEPLLTQPETYQSTLSDVSHWAGTLTDVFVEGAFTRAFPAASSAPPRAVATPIHPPTPLQPTPALDPFALLPLGKDTLRAQLRPLSRVELLTIIDAYELNPAALSLARLTTTQLVTFIVTAAEVQARQGRR